MANREKKNSKKISKNSYNSEQYYERANAKKSGFHAQKKESSEKIQNSLNFSH
jgi:hypothetical protein